MKNIKLIVLCLFASFVAACSGTSLTPFQDAMKQPNHPYVYVPKNIQNAKPDEHFSDEKAIVVSLMSGSRYLVGNDEFELPDLRYQIEKLFEKNPSEKQLIYLNADVYAEYADVVKVLDTIRRTGAENIGLLVEPASGADKKMQVLKVKIPAEPQLEDPEDLLDRRLVINLQKDDKIKLGRFDKYAFKPSTPEVGEAEVGGRLAALLKENEEKKINLKGTSEIDRTVFVKATRANGYAEVTRLVDAAAGAGATEVYLTLDDLE
ncbi:MAG TPA: biopolymer transporter ExbD [Pyrinomonadaceae bacterium]|jgi:biopolymer transport protein ExbD